MTEEASGTARTDLICVGDISVDLYLTLNGDAISLEATDGGRTLALPFGAKIPCDVTTTVAAGGNSANVAVAGARLGLQVALAAGVGVDQPGRDALDALRLEGVDVALVRIDPTAPTNRNFVLRVDHERTILVHHEDHEAHWPDLWSSGVPAWLFLSSVGRDAHNYEAEISRWLEEFPQVSFAFEPGTLQIARGVAPVAPLYRRADLVICNRQEAATITGGAAQDSPVALLDRMLALGPSLVVITDGAAGAYGSDGRRHMAVPAFPNDGPVADRTGAGDAFAATLVASMVSGLPLEDAMTRAAINSMRVVQQVGSQAGLLRQGEMELLVAAAPPSFAVCDLPA